MGECEYNREVRACDGTHCPDAVDDVVINARPGAMQNNARAGFALRSSNFRWSMVCLLELRE
jgi:hypothetical protein